MEFSMDSAGMFSSNSIEIQSVRLEPYILSSNFGDQLLLALEVRQADTDARPFSRRTYVISSHGYLQIIFLAWLGKFYSDFLWTLAQNAFTNGFKALLKFWTIVDALNLVFLTLSLCPLHMSHAQH
jgi:hypothetical protein